MNKRLPRILIVLGLLVISACASVPESNRSQLLLIGTDEEAQLGIQEFAKLKESVPISSDQKLNNLVASVGNRISQVAPLPDAQWEFVVFDEPNTPNAFCLPGGKVGIYTGILQITQTEAGLATVMGHEVAHAVARHGAERMSRGMVVNMGGQVLDQLLQTTSETTRGLIGSAYGLGSNYGVMLPHSRSQELEADHLGLIYMARAGYDPKEAIAFWKRFQAFKGEGGEQMEFLSTHPLDDTRIAQLEKLLPEAMVEYRKSGAR